MSRFMKIIGNIIFILGLLFIVLLLFTNIQGYRNGEEPTLFGYRVFYVDSGSMAPTMPTGSLAIVEKTESEEIAVKDIITFKDSGNTMVTHRVMDIVEDQGFITKGDANEIEDPFLVEEQQLVGKVIFHLPYLGYFFDFAKSKYGIVVIAAFLLLLLLLNSLNLNKKATESK